MKRELYIKTKDSNDPRVKERYKIYCKILSRVISAAKKLYLSKIINSSNNKTKTTWKVIKNMTGNIQISTNVTCLNLNGNSTQNYQMIANMFNNFFLNVVNTKKKQTNKDVRVDKGSINYLRTSFQKPFQELLKN
jgi:hypothetical protein